MVKRAILLACLAAAGCSDGSSEPDAASLPDYPNPCVAAPEYQGDDQWTYQLVARNQAQFCAYNRGSELADYLNHKLMLSLSPGTYPLPDQVGSFNLTLPMCLHDDQDNTSTGNGAGNLLTEFLPTAEGTDKRFAITQSLNFRGEPWGVKLAATVQQKTGSPNPHFALGHIFLHLAGSGVSLGLELCPNFDCSDPWILLPCGHYGFAYFLLVTFDRGSVAFGIEVAPQTSGDFAPASLFQAEGMLDGTPFRVDNYYRLAHEPERNNTGGGFLVRFEQKIGAACGLRVEIPADDNSLHYTALQAWTVDCDNLPVDQLDGLRLGTSTDGGASDAGIDGPGVDASTQSDAGAIDASAADAGSDSGATDA